MKTTSIIFLVLFTLPLYSQDDTKRNKFDIELGFVYHFNDLNEDNYLSRKSPFGLSINRESVGLDFRVMINTNYENIRIGVGTILERNGDEYQGTATDYKQNGGGVYFGVSPTLKSRYISLTSFFGIGAFSYKEYFAYYSVNPPNEADIYEKKVSHGLGAISSIGIKLEVGKIGINPQVNTIYSGGASGSFFYYGFILPLTIKF